MMRAMRITVTLDSDVESLIRRDMAARRVTFDQALNDAVRRGLAEGRAPAPARTPTFRMGKPTVDLDRALGWAESLEDGRISQELDTGD